MNWFYRWCLKRYLTTTIVKEGDVVVLALKDEARAKDLEQLKEILDKYIPKTVIIAGVDKVIVA